MKQSIPLSSIRINDSYWDRYIQLIPQKVIPYQWEVLNDRQSGAVPSYCIKNFRIAAGEGKGRHQGMVFQDSDAAKWLEAAAYSLANHPDPKLEKTADELIALIGRAQGEDGYFNTYFTLNCPEDKWQNLTEGHELYCAGHLIEAAAAYFETTGKRPLLDIARRFADLICKTFGEAEGQIHGYPGHPEIELALVRLYRVTGEKKYLEMSKYFVETRGGQPNYFLEEKKRPGFKHIFGDSFGFEPRYFQSHLPVRQQDTAEGHAVRALYLYCAMADLADEYNDSELLERCRILWNNIVEKRMYVTGSVGSSGHLERFTVDYDLPNDSNYSETCASIALAMFGQRMAKTTGDASFFDTVELALYNSVRSGISLDGDKYFYVNPMEVWPEVCIDHVSKSHIKPVRQKWFDCACCPTNVARTFTSLGQYIYFMERDEIFINIFIQNEVSFEVSGKKASLYLTTDYPKSGNVKIKVKADDTVITLNIRIPSFASDYAVKVNGSAAPGERRNNYYRLVNVKNDDEISVMFSVKPRLIFANPKVHYNCGKVAIARGPEIFCLEECDNSEDLTSLSLDTEKPLVECWREDLLGGIMTIKAKGKKQITPDDPSSFSENFFPQFQDADITAVPYGFWCNRSPGEMLVWIRAMSI
ncbi:MAG: glycoside hydrolase family 127 protein [Treponema sp.]|nr:glycoside hydrolase family 127 protein [Treponema sp.]MCL2271764.1 glycoside hydrolase family 127 protein [Treponema sp.]